MARELFNAGDRAKADDAGVYHLRDILVREGGTYIDAYSLQVDGSVSAIVRYAGSIRVIDYDTEAPIASGETVDLSQKQFWLIVSETVSAAVDDAELAIDLVDRAGRQTWAVRARLTTVSLALAADEDRDGVIDRAPSPSKDWTWGAAGRGAILLVNSDRDTSYPNRTTRDRHDRRINGPLDLEDMTEVLLAFRAPPGLDLSRFRIRVRVSDAAASRVRIFDVSPAVPQMVIGPGASIASWPAKAGERRLRLEGLDYPDAGFTGLITIFSDIVADDEPYATDKLVLRVAPWLALPNTQPASRLYIAEMADGSNRASIEGIREFARVAKVELVIAPPRMNRSDRWLQDEIEIGYAGTPTRTISVVLDSPRNRELDDFPELMILGSDFGYVTRGNDELASSLDSFGNLDCTPPHDSRTGSFPFGRILFGGALPGTSGRRMMKVVSDFMYAQLVQQPIELFSDWLTVGHVDEFMSFVPAPDRKGFRLVLASPRAAYRLLRDVRRAGHGGATLMADKPSQTTVDAILDDQELRTQNEEHFQKYIDWNKATLIREMGLSAADIVYLPALYSAEHGPGADAFFPGMVNMQVVNGHLAIPKPFGPIVDGVDVFEKAALDIFSPLKLQCHFIDTYYGYHVQLGEIHCGTNVVRQPFLRPWWDFTPGADPDARR